MLVQSGLMTVCVEISNHDCFVVGCTGHHFLKRVEAHCVTRCLLVEFKLVARWSHTWVSVVVDPNHSVPACTNETLFLRPVTERRSVFPVLFEFLHFDAVLYVYCKDLAFLRSDEELPLSGVHADGFDFLRGYVSENRGQLSSGGVPNLHTLRMGGDEGVED